MSLSDIIKPDELSQIVKCSDALEQYEKLLGRFATNVETAKYLRLKKGIAQELVDEFAPLCIYAQEYHGNSNNLMKYRYETDQSFDGEILNDKKEVLEQLEITCAVDGYNERLRMERLNKEGIANAFGEVKYTGRKENRVFLEEGIKLVSKNQLENHYKELVEAAYRSKKNKTGKYNGMILLIAIEDFLVKECNMDNIVEGLSLAKDRFSSIFLVNISSREIRQLSE